jgi:hypothetical protein
MAIKFNPFTGTLDYIGNVSATGINDLNGQTGNTQSFATDESGTDFQVNSLNDVHTFSLPNASGSSSGKLKQSDWNLFNDKQEYKVEQKTLSVIDIANKYIVLESVPRDASRVTLDIVQGVPQALGADFAMTGGNGGKRLSWDTLTLDGQLASGDILIVRYF